MKRIYLLLVVVVSVCVWLYLPKMIASANDALEQREINKQIMDIEFQLEDLSAQWQVFDDQIKDKETLIASLSWDIAEIRDQQDELHTAAETLRSQISQLKWEYTINDEIINCYQFEGELYNECLDAVISTGLM